MDGIDNTQAGNHPAMLETALGLDCFGMPEIPEPSKWDSAYGIDEAVAIAVAPERALIFWELASMIAAGKADGTDFRLVRLRLAGEIPDRDASWPITAIGRFQDSDLTPGEHYLYVIARLFEGEEVPLMVTNPILMPIRHVPGDEGQPSSIDLSKTVIERALRGGAGK
jgi:hypothetical protein